MYLSSFKYTVSANALYQVKQSCVWFEGLLASEVCRATGTQVSLTHISLKMFHYQICLLPIDLAMR